MEIPEDSIATDGAFNDTSKPFGFALVTDAKGNDLLLKHPEATKGFEVKEMKKQDRVVIPSRFGDVSHQNNGSELVAMVVGLRIALLEDSVTTEGGERKELKYKTLCSDSNTVISWSQGRVGKKTRENMDPRKLELIEECERLREEFERRGGKVLKISGDINPSDWGIHVPREKKPEQHSLPKPTKKRIIIKRLDKAPIKKARKIVILKS